MYSADDVPRAKIVPMTKFVRPYFEHAIARMQKAAKGAGLVLPKDEIVRRVLVEVRKELEPDVEPGMLMHLMVTGWLEKFVVAGVEALAMNMEERNERPRQD